MTKVDRHDTSASQPRRASARLPAIDRQRCTGCGWCVAACDLHLLNLETVRWEKSSVLHDAKQCTGCGLCAVKCPFKAITMRKKG
jgi:ferredoxin